MANNCTTPANVSYCFLKQSTVDRLREYEEAAATDLSVGAVLQGEGIDSGDVQTCDQYYLLTRTSGNRKTGPIPVSTSHEATCPDACPMRSGCYAMGSPSRMSWKRVTRGGGNAAPWGRFLRSIRALPRGVVWRHNQAGDLPHTDGTLNRRAVRQLASERAARCVASLRTH